MISLSAITSIGYGTFLLSFFHLVDIIQRKQIRSKCSELATIWLHKMTT